MKFYIHNSIRNLIFSIIFLNPFPEGLSQILEPEDFAILLPIKERDYSLAQPLEDNIAAVNKYYDEGHEITYWTARGSGSGIDWTEVTEKQLAKWGAKYHHLILGKPQYDLFIDDKCLRTSDWEERERCLPQEA